MRGTKILIPPALLLLAGCTPIDATFGDAVKTDYALQVINPEPRPVSAETAVMEGGSGDLAGAASERYRKGAVRQPQPVQTTTKSSGGAGPN
ncbi:hypothetical protein [Sphingomonas sp. Root241]|uniref:hypothetical protein n=1 Tax=Sphingomonas sp. Root241 TaxID=1736501 RepID=UPI0006F81EC2|nr:hypothetical protein [Sphingomonas sp. Root241]KRC78372.1 hypothetical protein ASE13_18850 [Sphingomonas sp. Root241]